MAREYIRNPETGRLVNAHGRLGQRIIRKLLPSCSRKSIRTSS
jgi:hypothetical protein